MIEKLKVKTCKSLVVNINLFLQFFIIKRLNDSKIKNNLILKRKSFSFKMKSSLKF
jgi:hypothetical protein